ncbi:hypothetical protein MMC25_006568 [Agyrium rufum]|nr:hypothetical protein [Agyrium rufum]
MAEANGLPQHNQVLPDAWQRKLILTLDGGGSKGLLTLLMLRAVMNQIAMIERSTAPVCDHSVSPITFRHPRRISGGTNLVLGSRSQSRRRNPTMPHRQRRIPEDEITTRYLPAHYFDYIAGTSSGGILAAMLGRLRMTPDECIREYEALVDSVFGHPRRFHIYKFPHLIPLNKFHDEAMDTALKEIVRRNSPVGEEDWTFKQDCDALCRTIIIAIKKKHDDGTRIPYLFRSYPHPKRRDDPVYEHNPGAIDDLPTWKYCRATSAAPSYFHSARLQQGGREHKFIDGGLGVNNPAEKAYQSVIQLHGNRPESVRLILSIGTGEVDPIEPPKLLGFGRFIEEIQYSLRLATQSRDTHKNMLLISENKPFAYERLNVETGLGPMDLDSWNGKNGETTIAIMIRAFDDWKITEAAKRSISTCAKTLVDVRRARAAANPDEWELFCHGVYYECLNDCKDGRPTFKRSDHFRQHLMSTTHGINDPTVLDTLLEEGKRCQLYE